MRLHFTAAALVIVLALFFGLDRTSFIALSLAVVIVLVTEVINTAVESIVDLISEEFHPAAKIAKDTAAGAVFIASFGALVIGFLILYPHVAQVVRAGVAETKLAGENVAFMALIVVVILVIMAKSYIGRGSPLMGGMPSGHAATASSIFVITLFLTSNALVAGLVLMLAAMVAHSRIALKIHTTREVILGALLGGLVTLLIFLLFA
jgi:diacylglycerol kinase (ATP)